MSNELIPFPAGLNFQFRSIRRRNTMVIVAKIEIKTIAVEVNFQS